MRFWHRFCFSRKKNAAFLLGALLVLNACIYFELNPDFYRGKPLNHFGTYNIPSTASSRRLVSENVKDSSKVQDGRKDNFSYQQIIENYIMDNVPVQSNNDGVKVGQHEQHGVSLQFTIEQLQMNQTERAASSNNIGQTSSNAKINILSIPANHMDPNEMNVQFPWKPVKMRDVDCSKLFSGDQQELKKAESVKPPKYYSDDIIQDCSNCSRFLTKHSFITSPLTKAEKNFPIAFSIVVYKDPQQVLGLLRTIYRPQNYYCLHVDSGTEETVRQAFQAMTGCLDNVFVSSRSVRVKWGKFSVLEAELICMQDLWQYKDWRYLINLTGQEYPLKTNYEIVQILTTLHGANDVLVENTKQVENRWYKYLPPPHNLTIYKGSIHISVSRPFVQYILTSRLAQDFLTWLKKINIPDEEFFNTLNHNPQLSIPGSYNGPYIWNNLTHKPHVSRFKNWHWDHWKCAGEKYVRDICILSAGDLPLLDTRPELFANKFYPDYSYVSLQCLAEKLDNRTRLQTVGILPFNVTYYEKLPFVKHVIGGPTSIDFKNESFIN